MNSIFLYLLFNYYFSNPPLVLILIFINNPLILTTYYLLLTTNYYLLTSHSHTSRLFCDTGVEYLHMLRIAMLHSTDANTRGGLQEHIYQLSKNLKQRGHRVTIIGPAPNKVEQYLQQKNYGTLTTFHVNIAEFGEPVIHIGEAHPISSVLQSNMFDIVHLHDAVKPLVGYEAILNVTLPKVLTLHSAWHLKKSPLSLVNSIFPLLNGIFKKNVQGVIAVSEFARKTWGELTKGVQHQAVIHNGVDTILFKPFPREGKNKRIFSIGYMSRMVERKGVKDFLEALMFLKKKQIPFVAHVAGDGPLLNSAKLHAYEHGLTEVTFYGAVHGEKRAALYQLSDVFCAPYIDEAFGLTLLEAYACGCPVVGYANDSFRKLLKNNDGFNLYVRQKDIRALANKLEYVYLQRSVLKDVSNWGPEFAGLFSWDKVAAQTESLYYRVLNT